MTKKKVTDIYKLISEERLAEESNLQVERLKEMPNFVQDEEIYDPNYVPAPLTFQGASCGIATLDDWLMGMREKDVVLFGSITDLGKSSLALYVALTLASQGKKVFYLAAEDDKEWLTEMYNKIIKANDLTHSLGRVRFLWEEEALRFIGKKQDLQLLIDTLKADGKCDWFFVDMLNNIADPLEDKTINEFMTNLRQHANMYGYSVWLNCRFREVDRSQGQAQQAVERFSPPDSMFYGKGGYRYNATKVIAMSEYEGDDGTRFTKALKILKGKRSKPGYRNYRHLIQWGEDLVFSQPMNPIVPAEVTPGEARRNEDD